MTIHETALTKIHNQIENGESDKIRWCELLKAFSEQTEARILLAFEKLSPSQLMSIRDGAAAALKSSKKRQMEAMYIRLAHEGISEDEFIDFLHKSPSPEKLEKKQKASEKKSNRVSLSKTELLKRDGIIQDFFDKGITSTKQVLAEIERHNITTTYAAVSSKIAKLKAEAEENKETLQI